MPQSRRQVMDFGTLLKPKAAKLLWCEHCGGPIPKGEQHIKYTGQFEGEWQNWRAHNECYEAHTQNGGGAFSPGDAPMPERVTALDAAIKADRTKRADDI